ncbi:branched-chain amino acid ABC transporter permease [Brachybacterium endophyticum]|uniref:Branched-chain amino acid ABC transporter permease n=1 Tax=Brachybacterium endophyticum TaxID=2182385 RepID=A0A2U2RMF3_9MICO|nr:AzlC family ABC transporter permease [Brachybacterium endophyticum]PWH07050.1 branched-chain amino acid ABC transporter permease [Brachybacterium endophyticum]
MRKHETTDSRPGAGTPLAVSAARRKGLSVGIATGLYGISFGALATASGLDVCQTMVLTAIMFTGGSQFAFVGVIGGGGSALGAALAAILLGIRNTLYGLVLAPVLPRGGAKGAARSLLTIDESAAVAATTEDPVAKRAGFWAAGLAVYVFWNLFSLVGALIGQSVGDPSAWGLDAAAAAAFLGLLWPRLVSRDIVAVAVAAAFIALITTPVLPAGLPVLAAALVAVLVGLLPRRPRTEPGTGGTASAGTDADGADDARIAAEQEDRA